MKEGVSLDTRVEIGRYRLIERIGAGGMAEVWRVESPADGRELAAKVMFGTRAFDSRYQARFVREVQSVASLNHPGIIRVFDHGRVEGEGGSGIRRGSPYLIMEIADGGTLEEIDTETFADLRDILVQLLDALAFAHARGVVHRDIKPANVLIANRPTGPQVKLSDFGIAHADDPDTELTRSTLGEAAGTPEYMPPEQLEGRWRDFGPWTDLYALGCMAWELSTGEVPFSKGSPLQIAFGHLTSELPGFEPNLIVPDGFEDWVRKLLEKSPANRYRRAADAAYALRKLDFQATWEPPSREFFEMAPSTGATLDEESSWGDDATAIISFDDVPQFDEEPSGDEMSEEDESAATAVLDVTGMSWRDAGSTEDRTYPPIPQDWRRPEDDRAAAATSLGLFGLREAPFIGREHERALLWEALRDAEENRTAKVVVLEGRSGTGKSRTVEWIAERAEELGVATVLRAQHGRRSTAKHGLGHMLSRHFVSWRIDTFDDVVKVVRERLEHLWRGRIVPVDDFIAKEASGLAMLVAPNADGGDHVPTLSADERLAIVQRVVERVASERPVLLWIDDAQWADEALALVERLTLTEDLPVLVALTVQSDAEPSELAAGLLDAIRRRPETRRATLDFLPPARQRELVQRLAGLTTGTADRVVRATGGNPLFAIQLISHWVQGGMLRPTPDGYVVAPSVDIPSEMQGLWQRRLASVTEPLGGAGQMVALELASVLGDDVLEVEWRGTCIVAGLEPHERLVETLVDNGLAVRFESGWSFVHKLVADGMRAEAVAEGRWGQLNRCCVEVLNTIYDGDRPSIGRRLAVHACEAGEFAVALEPIRRASEQLISRGDLREGAECLQVWRRALESLGVAEDDHRQIDQRLELSSLQIRAGNPDGASGALDAILRSGAGARPAQLARAFRLRAELDTAAGRLDDALANFERAEPLLSPDVPNSERAAFFESRAWAHRSLGQPQAAREDLERALDLHRASGDEVREVNVFSRLAATFLTEGHLDMSREVAEMGIELGRQLTNRGAEAACWMALGEVERADGNIEEARSSYDEAERLDELCGSRHVWLVRTNLALLDIAQGQWDEADRSLTDLQRVAAAVGYEWLIPTITYGLATVAAARGDWQLHDRLWSRARERAESGGMVERDFAWLAERVAEIAGRASEHARSRAALQDALRGWNAVGDGWKAREARIKLRSASRAER